MPLQLGFDDAFLRRLEQLALRVPKRLRGGIAGEHESAQRSFSAEFREHRPYVPGDDPRYIDWYASGRQERVFVKLGQALQDVSVHVLVDRSRSMAWGQPVKLTAGLRLAAAISYVALAQGDRLSLATFAEELDRPFGPTSGKNQVPALFRFLTAVEAGRQTSLAGILREYVHQHPGGGMLVLISDLLTPEALDEAFHYCSPPRWHPLVLQLLDPAERQPTVRGPVQLEDAESGQRITVQVNPATLGAYQKYLSDWRQAIETMCTRRGMPYACLQSDWPIERAVVPYLRQRLVFESL